MASSRLAPLPSLEAPRLFGTDGIRGIPGEFPLDRDSVVRLVAATAAVLLRSRPRAANGGPPRALIVRDGRGTGSALAAAVARGLARAGIRAVDLGILPTPSLSRLVPRLGGVLGVSISASHNPARYNGLKFFAADGFKMSQEAETRAEKEFFLPARQAAPAREAPRLERSESGLRLYRDFLRSSFPAHLDLRGLRLVVDCANGASSTLAPDLLRSLGAEVAAFSAHPDGTNINLGCGSVHPERMARAAKSARAFAGLSFDGDADRVLIADETGKLWDGDFLIAFAARELLERRLLRRDKVVVTTMSNYALLRHLEALGITTVQVPVGDRNVSDALERENLSLGGESSGHLVFWDWAKTGDGMLTALQTLAFARARGRPLSSLRPAYVPVPQVILNVPAPRKPPLDALRRFQTALKRHEAALKGTGRIVARYSGTEPLLRLMVEGPGARRVRTIARALGAVYLNETSEEADWDEL